MLFNILDLGGEKMKKNIIIIGSRGYNFSYGGWETFVSNLVDNENKEEYKFYIPTLTYQKELDGKYQKDDYLETPYIYTKEKGFATMFTFTINSMRYYLNYIKENHLTNCVMLILGCKIGPLMPLWFKKLHKLGVKIILNPDGLEWSRDKWSWWIKQCFKISERYSIKYSDAIISDSRAIQKYMDEKYKCYNKPSYFIAYGAYLEAKGKKNKIIKELFQKYQIKEKNYYLIVGRFIPENNYETIIKEFMKSKTTKDLIIICNVEQNKFYEKLEENTHFQKDKRIKFVGSLYDHEGLIYIRENAYAYLHGHSAGGTNPSLLEALSKTKINILYDVAYNREVGELSCLYFTKDKGDLCKIIDEVDNLTLQEIENYGKMAKERIKQEYTWNIVVNKYNKIFEDLNKRKN